MPTKKQMDRYGHSYYEKRRQFYNDGNSLQSHGSLIDDASFVGMPATFEKDFESVITCSQNSEEGQEEMEIVRRSKPSKPQKMQRRVSRKATTLIGPNCNMPHRERNHMKRGRLNSRHKTVGNPSPSRRLMPWEMIKRSRPRSHSKGPLKQHGRIEKTTPSKPAEKRSHPKRPVRETQGVRSRAPVRERRFEKSRPQERDDTSSGRLSAAFEFVKSKVVRERAPINRRQPEKAKSKLLNLASTRSQQLFSRIKKPVKKSTHKDVIFVPEEEEECSIVEEYSLEEEASWLDSLTNSIVEKLGNKAPKQSMADLEGKRLGDLTKPPERILRTRRLENPDEHKEVDPFSPVPIVEVTLLNNTVSYTLTDSVSTDTGSCSEDESFEESSTQEIWDEIVQSTDIIAKHFETDSLSHGHEKKFQKALATLRVHAARLNIEEKELYAAVRRDRSTEEKDLSAAVPKDPSSEEEELSAAVRQDTSMLSEESSRFSDNNSLDDLWMRVGKTLDTGIDKYVDAFENVVKSVQCAPMACQEASSRPWRKRPREQNPFRAVE